MNFDLGVIMGFGPSDSSWLPNRETTVAICTTLIAALVAVYVYKSITQRSFQTRTKHVANEVELVRLCEEIRDEPLSTLDRNIRQTFHLEGRTVGPYTFYFKNESNEKSALVAASRYGRVDIVKYFLNNFSKCVNVTHTANLDLPVGRHHSMQEVHKCSALYAACFKGSIETVIHLLKAKASINQCDCLGRSPLQVAAQHGHMMLVQELLGRGADVNISDIHGYTPLLSAVSDKHIKVVTVLLEHDADLYHTARDGYTSLHLAAESGSKQIVNLLLKHDPNLSNQYMYDHKHRLAPPIMLAASRGHISTAQLLMEASRRSPAQVPDILLLWGAALVSPQHKYIQASVQRYWIEALELKQQHGLLDSSLTPLEAYEYRFEMNRIDEVIGFFASHHSTVNNTSLDSSIQEASTPPKPNGGLSYAELGSNTTIYLSPESTTEVFYQSLIVFERCLGYGDPIVIKRMIEVAKYMLDKRKFHQCNMLLCRSLEMSTDRVNRYPRTNFCYHSEMAYEIKTMLRLLCDIVSDLLMGNYSDMKFSVYLNYLSIAFEGYAEETRYDCYNNPAKINEHIVILMLSMLAAWVYYRNKFTSSVSLDDVHDTSEVKEFEECESLARRLVNQHMFICNGTTLVHLTLAKLGTRDSLVRNYPFLKNLSLFVNALLVWTNDEFVNLANIDGDRPLHVAAQRARNDQEASQLIVPLLKHGAHRDGCNAAGKTPAEIQRHKVLRLNRPNCLACLCYSKIVDSRIAYDKLPISRHFTQRDKELLRLHDSCCARLEYQSQFESRV